MHKVLSYIHRIYKSMVYSIAFIPTLMIFCSLILGLLIFNLENSGYTSQLRDSLKMFLILEADNARMILTTIIGGIISLTVFSFSMVMVVLNRTSASLSPRVLPQLVAQKFHQIVLGFYMGTIVFSLILIIKIGSGINLPSLGILLSMIFAVLSLGLFIYFIHSISQSIQVENILTDILKRTRNQIKKVKKQKLANNLIQKENIQNWWKDEIVADKTGYYQVVNIRGILTFLRNHSLQIEICFYSGQFIKSGTVLVKINKEQVPFNIKKTILEHFILTNSADDEDQYYFGMRKISEIAVKALSPGINDPGTALKAIRFLTLLFEEVLTAGTYLFFMDKKEEIRLLQRLPDINILLFDCITPVRQYAENSLEIHVALYDFFHAVLKMNVREFSDTITAHLAALTETTENQLQNTSDRKIINDIILKIKKLPVANVDSLKSLPVQTNK